MANFNSTKILGDLLVTGDTNVKKITAKDIVLSGEITIPDGQITGLNSANVTGALGFTPIKAGDNIGTGSTQYMAGNTNIPQGTVTSIEIGTTTTGAAGTNASLSITGTAAIPIVNFTIPRGATGGVGPTGPSGSNSTVQGPTGPSGPSGPVGQGFIIGKIFNSLAALLSGTTDNGKFGLVAGTLSPDHEDYGKLYLYNSG